MGNLPLIRRPSGPWVWLAAAVAIQLVANGRWILPPLTWLAPIGWLMYLERTRRWRGGLTALATYVLVQFVVWRTIIPAPGLLYYAIAGTYAIVYFLPYMLHRGLAHRLRGFKATLVFPAAWVGLEILFQNWITPYGSWISVAYTQTDFLPMMQLAAITGIAGISFLMTWFAAVVVWSLGPERSTVQRARAALVYGFVILSVVVFGHLRLAVRGAPIGPVRVAGIIPQPDLVADLEKAFRPIRQGEDLTESDLEAVTIIAENLNNDLFARTVREARAGARLVAWSETAGRVSKSNEDALLERARGIAVAEAVDLVIAYGVWNSEDSPPFENKVVAVTSTGDVAWDYQKAHPIVGAESPFMRAGDGVIDRLETPYGAVGAVICHDLDFAPLLRQANRQEVGLIVGPAADWPAIATLHANMAIPRAIENGFTLLRPTYSGRSIVVDSRGRTLAMVDYSEDAITATVSAVPVRTIYGVVGDLFAWLCFGALVVLGGLAVVYR